MTDIFDRASALEELQREHAIARHQSRMKPPNSDLSNCIDCEEEIAPARRAAVPGCTRCATCQRAAEARHKTMNR